MNKLKKIINKFSNIGHKIFKNLKKIGLWLLDNLWVVFVIVGGILFGKIFWGKRQKDTIEIKVKPKIKDIKTKGTDKLDANDLNNAINKSNIILEKIKKIKERKNEKVFKYICFYCFFIRSFIC